MSQRLNVHLYTSALLNESRMFKMTKVMSEFTFFDRILLYGTRAQGLAHEEALDDKRAIRRIERAPNLPEFAFLKKIFATVSWCWRVWDDLKGSDVACVNCHSLNVLPLGVLLKWKYRCRLIYDAHELETETTTTYGARRLFAKIMEQVLIGQVDGTIVVGQRIADWYAAHYALRRLAVIRNIPPVPAQRPPARNVKEILGIGQDEILFIHVGVLAQTRNTMQMLDLFTKADMPHHLLFMGYGVQAGEVERIAARHSNLHYLPPVPWNEVVSYCEGADVGLLWMQNNCLSARYCLPNKFFEYVMAGLPVMFNVLDEIHDIVIPPDAGWMLTGELIDSAPAVRALTMEAVKRKRANMEAVRGQFSWEQEAQRLREFYSGIFADPATPVP